MVSPQTVFFTIKSYKPDDDNDNDDNDYDN